MALTKVSGGILDPGINVAGIVTATGFDGPFTGGSSKNINAGIITATKFVGPFDSVVIGGGTTITSDGVNVTGIVTCTELDLNGNGNISGNLVIDGNLTANGDFTTLNTTLREVEILRVDANTTAVAGIITQRGSGDILRLYDGTTQRVTVDDEGNVGVGAGAATPHAPLHIRTGTTGAITTLLKLHGSFTSNTGSEGTSIDFGTAADTSIGARIIGTREAAGAKGALRFCTGRENDAGFNDGHMVIDETGKIGINTTDASHLLTVFALSGNSTIARFKAFNGNSNFDITTDVSSHGQARVRNNIGATKVQLNSNGDSYFTGGDVGIGTNNPSHKLDISGDGVAFPSASGSTLLRLRDSAGTATLSIDAAAGSFSAIQFGDSAAASMGSILYNHVDDSMKFNTGGTGTKLFIASDGDVGIGTDNPAKKLEVFDATQGVIRIRGGGGGSDTSRKADLSLFASGAREYVVRADASDAAFKIIDVSGSNAERFVINSSGDVGINVTAESGHLLHIKDGSADAKLKIESESGNDARLILDTSNGGGAGAHIDFQIDGTLKGGIQYVSNASASDTHDIVFRNTSNTERLRINSNGTVHTGMTGTAPSWLGSTIATREKFSIFQGANFGEACFNIDVDNANSFLSHNMYYDGGWKIRKSGQPVRHLEIGTDGWKFMTGADGSDDTGSALTERFRITPDGNLTVTGSTSNLFTSNSYNILELRADENNDGGNDDCIFKFTHDGTFRSEMRYDESSSTLEISTADNRDDFSMDTDGKVTFAKDIATAQDYPTLQPTLDFNFAATKKLDPRINYVRTGTASYLNEFGKIVTVGENEPRFDHDPTTLESKGLLIEESRQNMFRATADMGSNAGAWSIGGTRGRRGVNVEGPDGKMTALQNIYLGTSGDLNIFYETSTGATEMSTNNSTVYTFSVFAKMKPGNSYINSIRMRTFNPNRSATFYIHTGSLGSINEGSSSISSRSIIKYPNGWYRCIMTFTSGTDGNQGFQIYLANQENASLNSSSANGEAMYFWGAQLEIGSFATSFIPTQSRDGRNRGTQTTRGLDIVTIDKHDIDGIFNPEEGTMFYEAAVTNLTNDNQPIAAFRDVSNTAASYHAMGHAIGGSAGSVRTWAKNAAGSNIHLTTHTGLVAGSFYKHMYGYKYNDYSDAFGQGTTLKQTNTTSGNHAMNAPGLVDELRFGGYYTSAEGTYTLDSGHIRRFSYWPKKLTNTQIKTYVS